MREFPAAHVPITMSFAVKFDLPLLPDRRHQRLAGLIGVRQAYALPNLAQVVVRTVGAQHVARLGMIQNDFGQTNGDPRLRTGFRIVGIAFVQHFAQIITRGRTAVERRTVVVNGIAVFTAHIRFESTAFPFAPVVKHGSMETGFQLGIRRRIGRTGRAGRAGRALLFVENRERRLLRNIERTMKLTIPEVELPNAELLGKRRLEKFAAKVQQQLESSDLDQYRALLSKIQPTAEGEELDLETLAAALLKMAQGERTLIVPPDATMRPKREFRDRDDRGPRDRNDRGRRGDREDRPRRERRDVGDMQLYRIEVGRDDGVEVRHIVGAIANEGDISSRYIGNIKLFASHSTIELPKGMPGEVLQHFTRTRILNKPMNMQLLGDAQPHTGGERRGGGRGFGGERREGGRNFSGERREGGRGDGRRFSGER